MLVTANSWYNYRTKLSKINKTAAELMQKYVLENGFYVDESMIQYAYSLTSKYGEAAAELACQMHDEMVQYWKSHGDPAVSQSPIEEAEQADTLSFEELKNAIYSTARVSPTLIPNVIERAVKLASADTTLKNAIRDGAEWAWIPSGDTCPFCLMLAGNGWQPASKKMLKKGHAEHIHANCDCAFAIRFGENDGVEGYDPSVYKKMYDDAEGATPQEKLNAMRRAYYAKNKATINANKRLRYKKSHEKSLEVPLRFMYNNKEEFIPRNTIIDYKKTIAGKGSKTEFRKASLYAETYGRSAEDWSKRVGTIKSDKFLFDVHWYENGDGNLYDIKIKSFKERK